MSVYKRPGSETYSYDFKLGGRRFSGALPTGDKRKAESLEKQERARAKLEIEEAKKFRGGEMTWEVASSRYWLEVGQHHKNAGTTWRSLGWLTNAIGPRTALAAVDDRMIAELVSRRRAETRPTNRKKKDGPKPKRVGPATVNRTMTEVVRKVWNRAQSVWKVRVGEVHWRQHMLPEPQERVREASREEEASIMDGLDRGYDDAVEFAFNSGCRRMEVVGLVWTRVDFENKQFSVIGKGGRERIIPMTTTLFRILWRQKGNHEKQVFTYVAARASKIKDKERVRGARYPITDAGLRTAMRRATDSAGVANFRFHDTRHTMATRTLRSSNTRAVQNMLGHARLTTTEKYAHVMIEDMRAAMEAASPTPDHTDEDAAGDKPLKLVGE